MREILFRGKDLQTGEWRYGSLVSSEGRTPVIHEPVKYGHNLHYVDKNTVGQFTGVFDKTKKRIFEGDIIFYEYQGDELKAEVIYKGSTFLIGDENLDFMVSDVEIVGNRFDNPLLLEGV